MKLLKNGASYLFTLLAGLFITLGIIGIFIPVLPTVPFLLLAVFFLGKANPVLLEKFKATSLYQKHLLDYETNKTMSLKTKWCILIPVTCLLILATIKVNKLPMTIAITLLLLIKYYVFLFVIKTKK